MKPMPGSPDRVAWVLAGPTAAGKTSVAHRLAVARGAHVLSADAMAVYRGMDVGTAKPGADLRAELSYHGLDLVDPDQPFSAGAFVEEARRASDAAQHAGRPLIIVGGTGLYLSALLRGLSTGAPADPALRARWEQVWREQGLSGLHAALRARAPEALANLADPQNPRRVIRALERLEAGAGMDDSWTRTPSPIVALGMAPDRLKRRIAERVRAMFRGEGLLEEARRLRARWPQLSPTARHAIGYAEAFAVLDGSMTIDAACARAASRTWQLARRQMTWFRHQLPVSWVQVTDDMNDEMIAAHVSRQWEQDGPSALHF